MNFAVNIIRLVLSIPKTEMYYLLGRQLLRSGTSVGANYRAACRAKSKADFISKMTTVEEECDESIYWMEVLIRSDAMKQQVLEPLMNEADEILAMVVSSIRTARSNR